MKMKTKQLETSPRVQVRVKLDEDAVVDYTQKIKLGHKLPAITVFNEPGTERFIVADGHHTYEASMRANLSTVDVDLREGTETDAFEYSLQANQKHGVRLKPADRRKAVKMLLASPLYESKYTSDRACGDLLGMSAKTFAKYRVEIEGESVSTVGKEHGQRQNSNPEPPADEKPKPPANPPTPAGNGAETDFSESGNSAGESFGFDSAPDPVFFEPREFWIVERNVYDSERDAAEQRVNIDEPIIHVREVL